MVHKFFPDLFPMTISQTVSRPRAPSLAVQICLLQRMSAMVYTSGQAPPARQRFEQAMKINPHSNDAADAKKQLAQLRS